MDTQQLTNFLGQYDVIQAQIIELSPIVMFAPEKTYKVLNKQLDILQTERAETRLQIKALITENRPDLW